MLSDKEGARFPWRPKTFAALLDEADAGGGALLDEKGAPLPAGYLKSLDFVALYFSAHWVRRGAVGQIGRPRPWPLTSALAS